MMSKRNYIILLLLLIVSEIVNLPYLLFQIPFFDNILIENELSLGLISTGLAFLVWWLILNYFLKRKWTLSFVSGICLAISSGTMILLTSFGIDVTLWSSEIAKGFIFLSYPFSLFIFGLSFLITQKTSGLKLIRIYGIMVLLSLIGSFLRIAFDSVLTDYIMSLTWIIKSILFALHIIYERNTAHSASESDEILDAS